jgi:hypothetical protein
MRDKERAPAGKKGKVIKSEDWRGDFRFRGLGSRWVAGFAIVLAS